MKAALAGLALCTAGAMAATAVDTDPNLWLSDIHGAKALAWVKDQNARSDAALKSDPRYAQDYAAILKSLDVPDRIPLGQLDHGFVYDFWQGADHVRGLWRRTTVADYAAAAPHWQTLLDLDRLDADEHVQWVWEGAECAPGSDLCLVRLSPGGGDASVVREFDLKTEAFVKDGFTLPVAKSNATYLDANTILFASDFGPGTLTASSYPRIVKLWHRGTPIANAKTVFEAQPGDIAARPRVYSGPYGTIALMVRGLTFFTAEFYLVDDKGGAAKIDVPVSADLKGATGGWLIFLLRDGWTPTAYHAGPIPKGALIALDPKTHRLAVLTVPGPRNAIDTVSAGCDAVYASIYDNAIGSVHEFRPEGTRWSARTLPLPAGGSTTVVSTDDWSGNAQFVYESFLTPPTL